jgi:hypothetical protein
MLMKSSTIGAVVGACVAALALTLGTELPYAPGKTELIAKWRLVRPGMSRDEVIRALGSPTYDFKPGEGYPDWAKFGSADTFYEDHGLLVFTITRMGPQLLLIYVDRANRVAFVSSVPT